MSVKRPFSEVDPGDPGGDGVMAAMDIAQAAAQAAGGLESQAAPLQPVGIDPTTGQPLGDPQTVAMVMPTVPTVPSDIGMGAVVPVQPVAPVQPVQPIQPVAPVQPVAPPVTMAPIEPTPMPLPPMAPIEPTAMQHVTMAPIEPTHIGTQPMATMPMAADNMNWADTYRGG